MTSPMSERLAFILETQGGGAVVNDLQRIGAAGEQSQTRLQQQIGAGADAFERQGRAGGTALAVVSDGASRSTTMLGRMSERLGITESTLRTGIATAATIGFGMLIRQAAESVNQFIELAGEVRGFQRASGASAEESSRFVAVLDDLQISAEQGANAIGKLARVDPAKLAAFGIEVERAADGTVSLTETLLNVADAYAATADPQQRALLGNAAFGRSYQQLIPLLEQGRAGLQSYFDGVSAGQVLTQQQLDSARQYELALDNLQDSVGDLSRAAGEKLVPALTSLFNVAADLIGMLDAIPGPMIESTVAAVAFAAASVGIARGLNAIRAARAADTIGAAAGSVTNLGAASAAAAGPTAALGRTASSLAKVGAAGAAIGFAIPILTDLAQTLRGLVVTDVDVDRLATSLEFLASTGGTSGVFADLGGIEGFTAAVKEASETSFIADQGFVKWSGMSGLVNNFNQGTETVRSFDETLATMVKGGNAAGAEEAFRILAKAAEEQGIPIEKLRELFPQYADAVEDAALADAAGADAAGEHGAAVDKAAEKMERYETAVQRLAGALDRLNGSQLGLAESDIALRDSMADFTEAVQENIAANDANALSLDRATQNGRDNESALLDQIAAAEGFAEATTRQTGSVKAGERAFQTQIESIRANMIALGFNRAEVDALIGRYARVPSQVHTRAGLTDEASWLITHISQRLRELDGSKAMTKIVTVYEEQRPATKGKATGGAVQRGEDYLVGEVRPEVFRPTTAGTIVPTAGVAQTAGRRDGPLMNVEGDLVVRENRDIHAIGNLLAWSAATGANT